VISFDASEKWENLDGLGEEILQELKGKGEGLMMTAGTLAVTEVKNTLTGTRTGRTYKVSKTGRLHTASAPGEPPAVLFGHLRNSVGHTRPVWSGWEIGIEYGPGLGANAEGIVETYSRRLEYGGGDSRGGMIQARPYMLPSADRLEPVLERLFEDGL
jgi:hypothetical protein